MASLLSNFVKNLSEGIHRLKCKILIVFGYMIADMLSNKKFNPIITELYLSDLER